jgi:hypothetical protein
VPDDAPMLCDIVARCAAEEKDDQRSIDQKQILYRVILFLATVTFGLFSRVLGRTIRRSVPSWAKGGSAFRPPPPGRMAEPRGAALPAARFRPPSPGHRAAGRAPRGCERARLRGREARRVKPAKEHESTEWLCSAHPEHASLDRLERVGLQIGEREEQLPAPPTGNSDKRKPARGPRIAVQTPHRHMGLKRRLEGRKQNLELFEGQAGEIQELRGAEPHVSEPYTGLGPCLLILRSVCHATPNYKPG